MTVFPLPGGTGKSPACLRYLDVCSGISAPTMAWKPLGWQAACYAEIEAAPRAVLAHHYPDVPLVGDFTTIKGDEYGPVDLLVGGTPCQSFSVAGLRGGLDDDRGNLALEYLRLADRARPRWLVWENVPGVLSSNGGRDFGAILGGMGELGYGFAYRVLDAQHFRVPQRRRRVFAVGYLGDWRRAAAVLFERYSLSGHPAPRREARAVVAALTSAGVGTCGADDNQGQAGHLVPFASIGNGEYGPGIGSLRAKGADCGGGSETLIAHSLRGEGFDASEDGTGRGTPLVPVAFDCKASGQNGFGIGSIAGTQRAMGHAGSHTNGGGHQAVAYGSAVRRLTPRECERLQGFPDDFTLVPYRGRMTADGPRYKMLGNSMAVPVVRWIGERIAAVEAMSERLAA
jgi:DNA (cytosine-5)-methyltransferase 1